MALKGFLWYQGEANTNYNTDYYGCSFPSMIDAYRREFSLHSETAMKAPFGFVQLAANRPDFDSRWPEIRWHQTADMGIVPNENLENVFMAVAMDTYDANSPIGTVHPRYKKIVAERLSYAGLNIAYGMKNYPTNGPYFESFRLASETENEGLVTITYDQDIIYDNQEVSGYYYCCSDYASCDIKNGEEWKEIVAIIDIGRNFITFDVKELCVANETWKPPHLAYLWKETPIQGYLTAPIYSRDDFRLPAAPWKISSIEITRS